MPAKITKSKRLYYECRKVGCHNLVHGPNEACGICAKAHNILPQTANTILCANKKCARHVQVDGMYCMACTAKNLRDGLTTTESVDISNKKLTALPKEHHYMFSYGEIDYVVHIAQANNIVIDKFYYFATGHIVTEDILLKPLGEYLSKLIEEEITAPARKKDWFTHKDF